MRYEVFISYRHVPADRRWAKWLHSALETYRIPRSLQKSRSLPARIGRVFRDEEELAASANLSDSIQESLRDSRFLVVVCSPEAKESRWVDAEVERFRSLGRGDQILALLISGKPRDAFPRALCEIRPSAASRSQRSSQAVEEIEPLAADVRPVSGESAAHRRRMALLRIVAAVAGCRFDDLRLREQERQVRRLGFVAGLMVLLASTLTGLTLFAFHQRKQAQAARAEETVARDRAERRAYVNQVSLALAHWNSLDTRQAEGILDLCDPRLRGWDWAYVKRLCHGEAIHFGKHGNLASAVAVTPDGSHVLSGGWDSRLRLWSAKTGTLEREMALTPEEEAVRAIPQFLTVTEDGRSALFFANDDSAHRGWVGRLDLATGQTERLMRPSGSPAVAAARQGWIAIDLSQPSEGIPRIEVHAPGGAAPPQVYPTELRTETAGGSLAIRQDLAHSLAWSRNGRLLAAGFSEGLIQIFDREKAARIQILGARPGASDEAELDQVLALDFDPGLSLLACGSEQGLVRIWDLATGAIRFEDRHEGRVERLRFSADGKRLITSSWDTTLRIYEVRTGQRQRVIRGSPDRIHDFDLMPDGTLAVTAIGDGSIQAWQLDRSTEFRELRGKGRPVYDLAFRPDGSRCATASSEGKVEIWDMESRRVVAAWQAHDSFVSCLAFSPDGQRLVTGCAGADGMVRLWNLTSMGAEPVTGPSGPGAWIEDVTWSPDGAWIVANASGGLAIWDAAAGRALPPVFLGDAFGQSAGVKSLAFDPNGKFLAAGGGGTLWILELPAFQTARTFQLHHVIQAVAVDPSGRYVAAAGGQVNEGRAKIWDLEQDGSETVLPGIGSQIFALAFSKDGKNLVAGCQDSTVRVWEVKSGAESITLRGHRADVQALDFDARGLHLATAASDGQVLLWEAGERRNK